MMLSLCLLKAAYGLVGNRAWGDGKTKNWIGVLFITLGISLETLKWSPIIFGLVYFFRAFSPRSWIHLEQGKNPWFHGIIRGLVILPLGVFISAITLNITPYIFASCMVFLIPVIYYIAGHINKTKSTEIAEIATGVLVGQV